MGCSETLVEPADFRGETDSVYAAWPRYYVLKPEPAEASEDEVRGCEGQRCVVARVRGARINLTLFAFIIFQSFRKIPIYVYWVMFVFQLLYLSFNDESILAIGWYYTSKFCKMWTCNIKIRVSFNTPEGSSILHSSCKQIPHRGKYQQMQANKGPPSCKHIPNNLQAKTYVCWSDLRRTQRECSRRVINVVCCAIQYFKNQAPIFPNYNSTRFQVPGVMKRDVIRVIHNTKAELNAWITILRWYPEVFIKDNVMVISASSGSDCRSWLRLSGTAGTVVCRCRAEVVKTFWFS